MARVRKTTKMVMLKGHGGHGDGNDGPYDDGCDANAVKC